MGEAELCHHIDRTIRLGERYMLLSNSSLTNRTVRNLPCWPDSGAERLEDLDRDLIRGKIKGLLKRKKGSQTPVNLEERLHQTVLERRASNNLLQKIGASIASASSFGMSFYVESAFYATPEALMLAGAGFIFGAAAIHSSRALVSKGLATLGTALAATPLVLDMPESLDLNATQTAYVLVPGLSVIQGVASAAGWRWMGSIYNEVAELAEFANDSKMARRKLIRTGKLVKELEVPGDTAVREAYSDECIRYIEGGGAFPKPAPSRRPASASRLEISTVRTEPRTREPGCEVRAEPAYDERAYDLLVGYGVEENEAEDLARRVSPKEAERIWNLLNASVMPHAETARGVIEENPQIFLQGKRIQGYADALRETLGIVSEVFYAGIPESFSIEHRPRRYASHEALDVVLGCLSLDDEKSAVEASYVRGVRELGYDPIVLEALLCKGFKLGSSSPRIGMRYTNGQRILHRAQSALPGGYDRELISTFQMLKRSGAVWMEKERKNTGAAGCWSITSHPATDIDDQPLRLFIRAAYDRKLPKFEMKT